MIRTTLSTDQDAARLVMTEHNHIMGCPRHKLPLLYPSPYATDPVVSEATTHYTLDGLLDFPQLPILFNQGGREFRYALHVDDHTNTIWWEDINEWFHRQYIFKHNHVVSYDFGYNIGTVHPMGPVAPKGMMSAQMLRGYEMWFKAECIR